MAKDCKSRGSFKDEYDAIEECRRLKDKYNSDYRPYRCNLCGMYHVTDSQYSQSFSYQSSSCQGRFGAPKKLYRTVSEAREACMESFSSAVDFYYCKKCKGYHLTSHPRDKRGLRK